jgi:hypothetical protein
VTRTQSMRMHPHALVMLVNVRVDVVVSAVNEKVFSTHTLFLVQQCKRDNERESVCVWMCVTQCVSVCVCVCA